MYKSGPTPRLVFVLCRISTAQKPTAFSKPKCQLKSASELTETKQENNSPIAYFHLIMLLTDKSTNSFTLGLQTKEKKIFACSVFGIV